jgi:deoxyribose-phosphate aldolase
MKIANFAKLFDHSIVRPNATRAEVLESIETVLRLNTASLIVQPHYIRLVAQRLKGSGVLAGTTVGFPHGNETPAMKKYQAEAVMELGAEEIDMVMNIPALKNGEKEWFIGDIQGVVRAAQGAKVKVITENWYLTQEEKRCACQWIALAGAHFVKTSTAYTEGGATLDDVRLMYAAVEGKCLVKAAGGIRKVNEILDYLKAGARRFGSSRTGLLVKAFQDLPEAQKTDFGEFLADLT